MALFLLYIQHMTQSTRVSTIIANVNSQTRTLIERLGDEPDSGRHHCPEPDGRPSTSVASDEACSVTAVDIDT